jgi:hypothetical protein
MCNIYIMEYYSALKMGNLVICKMNESDTAWFHFYMKAELRRVEQWLPEVQVWERKEWGVTNQRLQSLRQSGGIGFEIYCTAK